MLTIAICEDEPYFSAYLQEMLQQYLSSRHLSAEATAFPDGETLLHSGIKPDILLMDIRLPGKNGMEITAKLRRHSAYCQVIFITSYKEYAFQAFDLDAVHYLLKPVSSTKLYAAMDKAVKQAMQSEEKTVLLPNGETLSKIRLRDILYCEVFDHRLVIHTLAGDLGFSGTLDALAENLDGRFFRCHRSYLVNMDFVTEKTNGAARMAGGGRVLVARRKQQEFTRRLLRSCREEGLK